MKMIFKWRLYKGVEELSVYVPLDGRRKVEQNGTDDHACLCVVYFANICSFTQRGLELCID